MSAAAPLAAGLLIAGCGGDLLDPGGGPWLYRLTTANGADLPYFYQYPPSGGFFGGLTIYSGDFLFRKDGTFAGGVAASDLAGRWLSGMYSTSGSVVDLGDTTIEAARSGDSLAVTFTTLAAPLRLVYRHAPFPRVPVTSGLYVLAEVNGQTDSLILSDTTMANGDRYVHRVVFDSITFSDGAIFWRHRSERWAWYPSDGSDSLTDASEYASPGAYGGGSDSLILCQYILPSQDQVRVPHVSDTLSLEQGDLVLRSTTFRSTWVERYRRRDVP